MVYIWEPDFGTDDDPSPLAIIEIPDPSKHRATATAWAKEHPEAAGFIVVPKNIYHDGFHFYEVANGKAFSSSADLCQPNRFARQARHIAAQEKKRK